MSILKHRIALRLYKMSVSSKHPPTKCQQCKQVSYYTNSKYLIVYNYRKGLVITSFMKHTNIRFKDIQRKKYILNAKVTVSPLPFSE